MDHLWLDHDLQVEPDVVPYFEPRELIYTRGNDHTWSNRIQWLLHDDPAASSTKMLVKQTILQEYLFFGLLTEFCARLGVDFRREDFIARTDGAVRLTTSKLHLVARDLLRRRSADFDPEDDTLIHELLCSAHQRLMPTHLTPSLRDEGRELCRNLMESLSLPQQGISHNSVKMLEESAIDIDLESDIWRVLERRTLVLTRYMDHFAHDVPMPATLLSYCVMLETLSRMFDRIWLLVPRSEPWFRMYFKNQLDCLWLQRCRQNRLCPQRLTVLKMPNHPISQLYIATSIRSHTSSDHGHCTLNKYCQADTAAVTLPGHTRECNGECQIRPVTPVGRSRLEARIQEEGYGVLQFVDDSLDNPDFFVRSSSSDVKYVAFSHVWSVCEEHDPLEGTTKVIQCRSHGLGNPAQNALPTCQLLQLKRIMQQADCASHAFWLDPLCVPLDSGWKRRTVESMDKVYTDASKVIVLDRDVMRCKGDDILKRISIIMSDWVTRIWTLQEALLPGDKLFFAFSDGIKQVGPQKMHPWGEGDFSKALAVCSYEKNALRALITPDKDEVIGVISTFHGRAVTRPEDEAICLAILLGIEVQSLPVPATTVDVIRKLPYIEQDIVFAPGPRSRQIGFRWCPESFLSAPRFKVYSIHQDPVVIGNKGIRMEKDVAMIGRIDPRDLTGEGSHDLKWRFVLESPQQSDSLLTWVSCAERPGASVEHVRRREILDAALIFEDSSDLHRHNMDAILVSGTRNEDGELQAHYECTVGVYLFRSTTEDEGMDMKASVTMAATRLTKATIWVD